MYDCGTLGGLGPLSLNEEETKERVEALLSLHTQKPDIILSHGDKDHYSLVATVLQDTQVRSVWLGGQFASFDGFGLPQWLTTQEEGGSIVHKNLGRHFHNEGQPLDSKLSCGLADVYILTNSSHDADQPNEPDNADTLMLMIEYGEFSTIFSGDAEGETERQSTQNFGETLQSTVLMGSHHGATSHSSNNTAWAQTTKPDVTIFSAGREFGHPKCDAVTRYRKFLRTTKKHKAICDTKRHGRNAFETTHAEYMTHTSGTIVITTDGSSPLHLWCEGGRGCDTHIAF